MTVNLDLKIDGVKELTEKTIKQWSDAGAVEAHEDYSDAFDAIGILWRWIGGKMLHNVYKDDDSDEVKATMDLMLQTITVEAESALHTLAQFGIKITTVEDI